MPACSGSAQRQGMQLPRREIAARWSHLRGAPLQGSCCSGVLASAPASRKQRQPLCACNDAELPARLLPSAPLGQPVPSANIRQEKRSALSYIPVGRLNNSLLVMVSPQDMSVGLQEDGMRPSSRGLHDKSPAAHRRCRARRLARSPPDALHARCPPLQKPTAVLFLSLATSLILGASGGFARWDAAGPGRGRPQGAQLPSLPSPHRRRRPQLPARCTTPRPEASSSGALAWSCRACRAPMCSTPAAVFATWTLTSSLPASRCAPAHPIDVASLHAAHQAAAARAPAHPAHPVLAAQTLGSSPK